MTVDLLITHDDPRKVNKRYNDFGAGAVKVLTPTSAVDLIAPVFVISYNETYLQCNYLYCRDTGRFYYVDNITVDIGKKMYLSCRIDVLKTYAADIMYNSKACVIRSESVGKPTFIPDASLPIHPSKVYVTSYGFSSTPFNTAANNTYLLTVVNGGEKVG